jgi:hypothetical protein
MKFKRQRKESSLPPVENEESPQRNTQVDYIQISNALKFGPFIRASANRTLPNRTLPARSPIINRIPKRQSPDTATSCPRHINIATLKIDEI